MKTLRQEIEKLRDGLYRTAENSKHSTSIYTQGIADNCERVSKQLTDILSRHIEPEPEHTVPSQRERIATAVFLDLLSHNEIAGHSWVAQEAVTAADALIAELNKPTK